MSLLLNKYKIEKLERSTDFFLDIAESIVCQQLSDKAGATIWNRLLKQFSVGSFNPENIIKTSETQIQQSGVSGAKAGYLKNTARAFLDGAVTPDNFVRMSDDEVVNQLVAIKGIGYWTAEMFLIFSLGREDVFSPGDAGLRRAINKLYGRGRKISDRQIKKITGNWKPYRSYACLLLWKSLENRA